MPFLNNTPTLNQKKLNNLQTLNSDEINIGNININSNNNSISGVDSLTSTLIITDTISPNSSSSANLNITTTGALNTYGSEIRFLNSTASRIIMGATAQIIAQGQLGFYFNGGTQRVGLCGISNPNYSLETNGDVSIRPSASVYRINGVSVLSSTTLGSSVVSSSLTSLGTLSNLTINPSGVISVSNISSSGDLRIKTSDTYTLFLNNDKASGDCRINTGSLNSNTSIDNGNFSVKSGVFFVDALNNRVSINSITPSYPLDVVGDVNVSSGSLYRINGNSVLSSTTLGSSVINSSLTSLGTLSNLNVGGNISCSGNISGTLTSASQPNITSVGTLGSLTCIGNVNFDSGLFICDSLNNRVGIGRTPSTFQLEVQNDIYVASSNNSLWFVGTSDSSTTRLRLFALTTNQSSYIDWGNGSLFLRSGSGAVVDRIKLGATTSDIYLPTNTIYPNMTNALGTPTLTIRNTGPLDGSPNSLVMGVDGTLFNGVAYLDTTKAGVASDTPLAFRINSTEQMRLTSTGLGINGNITFKASTPKIQYESGDLQIYSGTGTGTLRAQFNSSGGLTLINGLVVNGTSQLATTYMGTAPLYLRGSTDNNHYIQYCGSSTQFASQNADGPAIIGFGGGLLGAKNTGDQWIAKWDKDYFYVNKPIAFNGTFTNNQAYQQIFSGDIVNGGSWSTQMVKARRGQYFISAANRNGNWNFRYSFAYGTANDTGSAWSTIGSGGTNPPINLSAIGTDIKIEVTNSTGSTVHYHVIGFWGGLG